MQFPRGLGPLVISDDLSTALWFLKTRVNTAPPRIVACGPRQVLHLYTDASHETSFSGIGAVCYDSFGAELWHFGVSLERTQVVGLNFNDQGTVISELEAMAVFAGLSMISSSYKHFDVISFIDSDSVLASMIEAGSPHHIVQNAATLVATIEVSHDIRLWFESAPSFFKPGRWTIQGIL